MTSFFIFAGEKSGDLHGGKLIKALKALSENSYIEGVAGPDMRAEGITGPLTMEDFEVMGLSDVIFSLPKLYRHFKTVREHILKTTPSAVVLIDYPGFNLRLAKSLRNKGYKGKIIQYVSPTVWAHGADRIGMMASTLDLLLTIYPFEGPYYKNTPLAVEYVGNPLSEYIRDYPYHTEWKAEICLPQAAPLVALFPGSRTHEIQRNLPLILETVKKIIAEAPDTVFGLSIANAEILHLVEKILTEQDQSLKDALFFVPKKFTYELMQNSQSAIAKSGTVTLELALHCCPTVVLYQLSGLNRLYAKYILKLNLSHYCIVNILAEEEIFPELIACTPTPETLFNAFRTIHFNTPDRKSCLKRCQDLTKILTGTTPPSTKAATSILKTVAR